MDHAHALAIAQSLVERLKPYCQRIEIAGGVRRRKTDCHDIEIVAIPRFATEPDIFGNPTTRRSLLDPHLCDIGEPEKNGPRYKKVRLPDGIDLDLFLVLPPAQFGVIYTIRTGPADYSHWLVTPKRYGGALPSHLRVHDGAVWNGNEALCTPEEHDFFKVIDLEWIEPAERHAPAGFVPAKETKAT